MSQSTIVRYKASSPNAKYLSVHLRAFTDNLRADVIQPILKKYNINELNTGDGEWMDAQIQLDMVRDIEAQCSFEELVALGVQAGTLFPLPPEIDTMEKFLEASPALYQIGLCDASADEQVSVEKLGLNHYRVTYNVPFPPFVMYGSTYGVLRRVAVQDEYPIITIIERGTPYVFDIKW